MGTRQVPYLPSSGERGVKGRSMSLFTWQGEGQKAGRVPHLSGKGQGHPLWTNTCESLPSFILRMWSVIIIIVRMVPGAGRFLFQSRFLSVCMSCYSY